MIFGVNVTFEQVRELAKRTLTDVRYPIVKTYTLDAIWVLYDRVLRVDPQRPDDPARDRFLLSKGHGPSAFYAVLAAKGFFPAEWLDDVASLESPLGSHPDATLVPGEVSLVAGDAGVRVQARHRFDVPGTFLVRVGVPPLPGERVAEDNWLDHQVRVVDRKVKVLYVDGRPRREWDSPR